MSISLFPHNAEAYDAAIDMLFETGKAAVVHHAGTGKSFTWLKLCLDYPVETVCWLFPSDAGGAG